MMFFWVLVEWHDGGFNIKQNDLGGLRYSAPTVTYIMAQEYRGM